jgi:hypothetical protein
MRVWRAKFNNDNMKNVSENDEKQLNSFFFE